MRNAVVLVGRLMGRPLLHELTRTVLTVSAVALGVAVIVAIAAAGEAAAYSFHSSLETLVSKTDLLVTANGGIDERVMGRLARLPFALELHPRTEDFAFVGGKGEAVPFFGLDLIGEGNYRRIAADQGWDAASLAGADPVWASANLGLKKGTAVRLLINEQAHDFRVAGVLPDAGHGREQQRFLVADIGLAQTLTGKTGRLDSIAIQVPPGMPLAEAEAISKAALPPGVLAEPQGAHTEENRKMLAAFRWNLRVLSYIALLVGGFLIYNTVAISVVRRRPEIGILRALGATRLAVALGFLSEALLLSAAGSIVGLVLGRGLSTGAVALVGNTVQALYVTSTAGPVALTPALSAEGLLIGIGLSLLAALGPAIEAARVSPSEAMARGRAEYNFARRLPLATITGIAFVAIAVGLSVLPPVHKEPLFGYAAVLFLVAGASSLIPGLVAAATSLSTLAQRLFGIGALLALRSLRASLGRTSVITAALTTAIAMTAAIAIMVGSFRETVSVWMNSELRADFYLRPAGSAAADRHPTIRASIADRLEQLPGVAAVDRFRAYPIEYDGAPATLGAGETSKMADRGSALFLPGENAREILPKLPTGNYAIVSEPFANKHSVHVGNRIRLPLGSNIETFQVLGIYYDYSTERGFVVLDRSVLLRYLPDPAASNLAIFLRPGARADAVRRDMAGVLSGQAVLVFANGELRRGAIAIFDQTFRITYALELIAVIVAVLGIAGSLLALVIDRRRDVAILHFVGAARAQIRALVLWESALLGALSTAFGLGLGTALSLILIFVINKQSFGWTIQFHWPAALLGWMLSGIYAATLAAGLYPARVAITLNPLEAVYEE